MKVKFNKIDKHVWHEKIAWTPTKVDDENEKHTYVFFEKYMRRGYASSRGAKFEKYSKKEYFKRKLKGEFEPDKNRWEPDDNDTYIEGTGSVGKVITSSDKIILRDDDGKILGVHQTYKDHKNSQIEKEADEILDHIRRRRGKTDK